LPLLGMLGRGLVGGLGDGLGSVLGGGLGSLFGGGGPSQSGSSSLSGGGDKFGDVTSTMGQGLGDSARWNDIQKGFQDGMERLQMEQAVQQATHSFAKTTSQNIAQT